MPSKRIVVNFDPAVGKVVTDLDGLDPLAAAMVLSQVTAALINQGTRMQSSNLILPSQKPIGIKNTS